jgi:hypothetical protein
MVARRWRNAAGVLAGVALLWAAAAASFAAPGTVTTRDGQVFEGEITEKGDLVTVMTKGNIPVRINKANVTSIERAGSVKEQFEKRLAKLAKNDAAGRVALADWALGKQEYDLAMDALDGAIAIDPNNEAALSMRRTVQTRRSLQRSQDATTRKSATATTAPAGEPRAAAGRQRGDAGPTSTESAAGGGPTRLVTPREINRIRQMELRAGDKVRVNLQNQVKQRYVANSSTPLQEFNRKTPIQQAMEILKEGPDKLHPDVVVATDPATLAQFKSNVQRYVLPGCASAQCHGVGNKDVKFTLRNPADKDPEAYTNFLLLQEYKMTVNGKERSMIDRTRPEDSLVLLMGLPPRDSSVPHPDVQNFRPVFRGSNDRNYQSILDWMEHSLGALPPDYGIDLHKPPAEEDSATRPSRRGGGAGEDDAGKGGRAGTK